MTCPCPWYVLLAYKTWYQSQGWSRIRHDDVIKWKHFPRHWPFVRGIHRSPVKTPRHWPLWGEFPGDRMILVLMILTIQCGRMILNIKTPYFSKMLEPNKFIKPLVTIEIITIEHHLCCVLQSYQPSRTKKGCHRPYSKKWFKIDGNLKVSAAKFPLSSYTSVSQLDMAPYMWVDTERLPFRGCFETSCAKWQPFCSGFNLLKRQYCRVPLLHWKRNELQQQGLIQRSQE